MRCERRHGRGRERTCRAVGPARAESAAMGQLLSRPPDWIHEAPVRIRAARAVAAEPEQVFAALADHGSWPEWFVQVTRVERLGEREGGVGSRRRVEVEGRYVFDEEINVWEPGERWGFSILSSTLGGLRAGNEMVTIERLETGGCRVTYTMALDPKPWAVPVLWFVRRGLRRNLEAALERLEAYLAGRREPA